MKVEIIVADKDLSERALRAIEQGRKIEAIKILREETGIGLAHAKVLVDRAAKRFAEQRPGPAFAESGSGTPRLLMSLFLAVLLFAVYRYISTA